MFVSLVVLFSSKKLFDAFGRCGWLSDPATGVVRFVEMLLEKPLTSTVRVCTVMCEVLNGTKAIRNNLLYLSVFLSLDQVTDGGRYTYTNFRIENIRMVQFLHQNVVITTVVLAYIFGYLR